MPLTYGSICSGIEAATVAWHPLGWRAEWFAEIEPFPSAVLAYRWPEVSNLGDMTKLARQVLAGSITAPEVLVGGTPCQAFSVAGMRAGLDDPRGQLTIKYVELADAVDHVRPAGDECVIVWENVPGVLSDKGNAFGCFLGALVGESDALQPSGGKWTDAGCVYGPRRTAAWRVLDAQYFGLAQRRRRVFVVASARDGFDPASVLFESEGLRRDTPPSRGQGQNPAAGTLRSTDGGSCVDHARANHLIAFGGNNQAGPIEVATACRAKGGTGNGDFESETFVVHGTQDPDLLLDHAHPLGRNHGQENAVLAFSCKDYGNDATSNPSPTLRAMGHGDSHANAGGQVAVALIQNATRGKDQNGLGVVSGDEPMYTLDQASQHAVFAIQAGALRTNPLSGPNGVGVQADHAYTLEARAEVQAVQVASAARRLTPRECERLQGFPDDYTLIPYGRSIRPEKMDADYAKYLMRGGRMTFEQCLQAAADGPRYKAIGNSKPVPVVRWIGWRIQRELERTR